MKIFITSLLSEIMAIFGLATGGFYTDSSTIMSMLVIIAVMSFIFNMALLNSEE